MKKIAKKDIYFTKGLVLIGSEVEYIDGNYWCSRSRLPKEEFDRIWDSHVFDEFYYGRMLHEKLELIYDIAPFDSYDERKTQLNDIGRMILGKQDVNGVRKAINYVNVGDDIVIEEGDEIKFDGESFTWISGCSTEKIFFPIIKALWNCEQIFVEA